MNSLSLSLSVCVSLMLKFPCVQITWYREGVLIEKSERFQTELRTELDQPHHSCLTILNTQVADSGNYRVVVRNEFGESEVVISLVVTGK